MKERYPMTAKQTDKIDTQSDIGKRSHKQTSISAEKHKEQKKRQNYGTREYKTRQQDKTNTKQQPTQNENNK